MIHIRYKYTLFFLLTFFYLFPQKQERIEKLILEISKCKEDSNKVKKLVNLGMLYRMTEYQKAMQAFQSAADLADRINFVKGQIKATNLIGDENYYQTNYEKSFQSYYKAYRISDSIHDEKEIAFSLYNLGWVACCLQQNYKEVGYLYRSMNLFRKIKNTEGLLKIYNALGVCYSYKYADFKKKNDFDSSVHYLTKGIELCKKEKLYNFEGVYYTNLGELFYSEGDFKSSKFYQLNALSIYQKREDSIKIVTTNYRIAECDFQFGKIEDAIKVLKFCVAYYKRNQLKDSEADLYLSLAEAFYKTGKYKEGFDIYKEYCTKKIALEKNSYATSMTNLENNYSLEKSEARVLQLKQNNEIQELKNKKKSYFIIILVGVGIVVIIIAFLLFRQNKVRQQTNNQLKEQNQIITEKKQEIDHSIHYAKGIQLAILPELKELNEKFPESFVYYKPKDVVSGDFYWFGSVEDEFYCLAADCTGHGVPGALMSIIGLDKIIQAIYEKKITAPNKILSYLNVQIKNVLKQHSDASIQKDGMDIALLKFNNSLSEVEYSAANRPLYFVRDGRLLEYKADKTAIAGFTPNEQEFTNRVISLQKNDCLFLSTDGYADQFGGQEGKKMMTRKLKDVLISISGLTAREQRAIIEKNFDDWKGNNEQVDDVLVIGIKI